MFSFNLIPPLYVSSVILICSISHTFSLCLYGVSTQIKQKSYFISLLGLEEFSLDVIILVLRLLFLFLLLLLL